MNEEFYVKLHNEVIQKLKPMCDKATEDKSYAETLSAIFHSLGVKLIVMSTELNEEQIEELIKKYEHNLRYLIEEGSKFRRKYSKEKEEENYIFSKKLREILEIFSEMDVNEALDSEEFWKTLCTYAGMSEEEFKDITKSVKG